MAKPALGETNMSRIIQSIRELWEGRSDAVGTVTLAASVTTTLVTAANIGAGARILLTPQTANAAAALATTYVVQSSAGRGKFTLTHANNAQTDRTFGWVAVG